MNATYNPLSWSVSRGRDTYGYNICRLDSVRTGHRFRTCGGGYDMVGTVLGDLIAAEYQDELCALFVSRSDEVTDCGYSVPGYQKVGKLYGLVRKPSGECVIDGACGQSSVIAIADAIGLSVTSTGNRKGHTIGFFISRESN